MYWYQYNTPPINMYEYLKHVLGMEREGSWDQNDTLRVRQRTYKGLGGNVSAQALLFKSKAV